MRITLTIGGNSFEADGTFTLSDIRPVLTEFLTAIGISQVALQNLIDRLNLQTDKLHVAITANTLTPKD